MILIYNSSNRDNGVKVRKTSSGIDRSHVRCMRAAVGHSLQIRGNLSGHVIRTESP